MRLNMTSKILESVQELNDDTKSLSYKALREEATVKGLRTCPRCGNRIIGYPAVSRYDDRTEICSDCGTEEALENMMGYITNPNTGERVSLEDLKAMRALENNKSEDSLDESVDEHDAPIELRQLVQKEVDKAGGKLPDTIEYKGKLYQAFNIMSPSIARDNSTVCYCNMENVPSGNPQDSDDYFYVNTSLKLNREGNGFKGVREINYVDDLTEEVTIDTPTQEDLEADEENTKAMNKKDIEDKIGKLRAAIQDGMSRDEIEATEKDIAELEDALKESVDLASNSLYVKIVNELDNNIYDMEKEEAIELLKQIKKDCDVFISSLKQIRR